MTPERQPSPGEARMSRLGGIAVFCAGLAAPGAAGASSLTAVQSFSGATGDLLYAQVTRDSVVGRESALYTTTSGGAGICYDTHGCGSVVRLVPPAIAGGNWTLAVLHTFTGPDGDVPYGGLMFDTFGALYGSTTRGGQASNCTDPDGCGTIFKMTPPSTPRGAWGFETLYNFQGGASDGFSPGGNPIFDTSGALYGTAALGGPTNAGMVFKLTRAAASGGAWTETPIYMFKGHDGARPRANLIFDTHGALYGTTQGGGAYTHGTVFKLAPPASPGGAWTETVLHSFNGADGDEPFNSLLFDTSGALYGTTWKGGVHNNAGVVFKLFPPATPGGSWTMSSYQMLNGADGATMQGGLTRDTFGVLYGTTNRGGIGGDCTKGDCGTVFSMVAPATPGGSWVHTVLGSFTGPNGGNPEVAPIFLLGKLYGTSDFGGTSNLGTIFEFSP
jgi:uncharacterized repeat protein (TIGR03803 family)